MERDTRLQGTLNVSHKPHLLGSPVKELSLKVPFMESLPERCPTTRALLQSPRYMTSPHTRFPSSGKGSPWREMPASRDFLNISSTVPSEGAPPVAPSKELLQREMSHPPEPSSSISQSPW